MNNKITTQMVSNRQKKKRLIVRAFVMTLFMALFTQGAMAQVYMHNGSSYVGTSGVKFYDSGGPAKGPANYWLHWFGRNQDFTYTFKPETSGSAIQVDFEAFEAYTDNNGTNDAHALHAPNGTDVAEFSLRLNDAELYVYEGEAVDETKLITTLTGTIYEPFTMMANGPITFRFKSYGYTEEGWGATVKQVAASEYKLQKPAISMEVCSDQVVINPTTLGVTVRYTTNGTDPSATNGTVYEGPFSLTTYPTTVKAVAVSGNNASLVADKTYNEYDATPTPNVTLATIMRDGNTIIINPGAVPDHLNETYAVIYTTAANGGTPEDPVYLGYLNPNNIGTYLDPDGWNGSMPGLVHLEWTTPNTNFKFCIVAKTCVKQSAVRTYQFGKLQVPDPTIDITDSNNIGTATIEWESGYVIRYTTDGSMPSTTNGTLVSSGTSVEVGSLTPGTTVRVVAYKLTNGAVDTNYDLSNIVSEMYLPGGGANGTYGGIVILNDLEEHEWSYYSDATQPINSLNPADVKITYYGNSPKDRTTMTNATASESGVTPSSFSATATGVKVNVDAEEDQFIYLKTLEKDQTAGNYPYTMIPNPFQVRPIYSDDGKGTLDETLSIGTGTNYSTGSYSYSDFTPGSVMGNTFNYYSTTQFIYTSAEMGEAKTLTSIGFYHNDAGSFNTTLSIYLAHTTSNTVNTNSPTTTGSLVYQKATTVGSNSAGWQTFTLDTPFEYDGTSNLLVIVCRSSSSGYLTSQGWRYTSTSNNYRYMYRSADYSNYADLSNTSNYNRNYNRPNVQFGYTTGGSSSEWRGFYAWRVKSLSSGLSIKVDNNTTYTSSNIDANSIIFADQEVAFVTSNPKDNEVEFEALWAQAYLATSVNNTSILKSGVSYERNFVVTTSNISSVNSRNATIMSIYPNGTTNGTTTATSSNIATVNLSDFSCAADTKFENINLSGASTTVTANNHNLIFGRGISADNTAAYLVRGYAGGSGTSYSDRVNNTFRIESGRFVKLYLLNNLVSNSSGGPYVTTFSSKINVKCILGSDYDRASSTNNKLSIAADADGSIYGSEGIDFTSSDNKDNLVYDWYVKSGTMHGERLSDANAEESIYIGSGTVREYAGKRRITIEGGVMASIAGGMNAANDGNYYNSYTTQTADNVIIRVKGGTIRGSIYGAAAYAGAAGARRIVITKGTVNGWIAGGCNGTRDDGGELFGLTYIYVGGKAKVVPSSATPEPYIGGTTTYGTNGAYGGYIFGAGCGIAPTGFDETDDNPNWSLLETNSVGKVYGSRIVVADECEVGRDVYGGGNFGFVADNGTGDTGLTGNTDMKTEIYILGGTIHGDVQGGSNNSIGQTVNIYVRGGELDGRSSENPQFEDDDLEGSVYGGSDSWGTINGPATIEMTGGHLHGSIFGGGYGPKTDMKAGTFINVKGGTIDQNVYGGGEMGTVSNGDTHVNISGGTMTDVYGAGKGESGTTGSKAQVTGQTFVNVTGGTIANVYGGGENGNVVSSSGGGSNSGEPLTYGFEDGTQGWTFVDNDGDDYSWRRVNVNDHDSYQVHGGSYLLVSSYNTSALAENWLISPQIDLGGELSFWVSRLRNSSYTDYYSVYVSTSGNAISNFTNVLATDIIPEYSYQQKTYSLENYSGRGYVAIVHTAKAVDQAYIFIDDVTITQPEQQEVAVASTVTINGGNISENVFGGGAYGTTAGSTIVNMKNGSVHGSVYGGALGDQGSVYVAGSHTVNVMGGRVYSNVYGGSRNANDALSFNPGTFADNDGNIVATDDETVCVVNISGGQIDQQVYAAGYYGNCFGSVYAFVGKNAIYNAPNHVETEGSESAGEEYTIAKLSITGSVWAGGDWGTFKDTFGAPTISGNSNVYIDGQDYITNTSDKNTVGYFGIDGSVYGSGTSCDAGNKEHTVMLRNYGRSSEPYESATRDFASIQRADYLVLDNVHLNFLGQGRINSLNVTEVYALYEVEEAVIVTGGSTLIMDAPVDQIKSFWSASCGNVFEAALPTSQTVVGGYTALTPTTLSDTPNKVRVNGGNYIKIYHDKQIATTSGNTTTYTPGYGMLNGYAYMMASSGNNEATCAYARPRWCYKNTDAMFQINDADYDNRNDGGWVSYVSGDNVFDLAGNAGTIQMEYENHTPGSKVGEAYFRIWRSTGQLHEREGVFDVVATGEDEFRYVDVEIELPAWRGHDYYYMFQRQGTAPNYSTTIDYGTELMTFNTALYDDGAWMTYDVNAKAQKLEADTDEQDEIKAQPNVNYGLVIMPGSGDALSSPQIGGNDAPALIINGDSDEFLVKEGQSGPVNTFTCTSNTEAPTVTFRLTYSDLLTSNKTYEPMWVTLVQCDKDGNVKDIVKVKLVVNTSTTAGRNFKAQVYAVMNGNGATTEETHVQVVLPRFTLNHGGVDSEFTLESIDWTPATTIDGAGQLVTVANGGFDKTKFAMEFSPSDNYDGTTGWNELNYTIYDTRVEYDAQTGNPAALNPADMLGTTSGRSQFSFDFDLYYNGFEKITVTEPELMGTIVYHLRFTNYGATSTAYPNGSQTFTITIEVYRRGAGTRYYLDGINGKNSNPGDKPDKAMLTLNAIFNRSGFLPGDEIYVVNQVTAEDGLEWNGLAKGGNVLIYRYNGGHPLSQFQKQDEDGNNLYIDPETGEETTVAEVDGVPNKPVMVTGEIIGNPDNTAYTGALIDVPSGATMTILGITLDGYYNDGGDNTDYSTVTASSPLINVEGTLKLKQNVTLQQNYNTNDGGAVYVDGGTLMMNEDAQIVNNKTEYNGGGVYMNGTMIVSDKVVVWDNIGDGNTQNNVYLASKASVLQIGVDADSDQYQDLAYDAENADESAKIGLTKSTANFTAGVAEVVYSYETAWLEEPLATQAIIVHDGNIYRLETGADPNKLYWRDTWVTAVTSQPTDFAINNIDSEEDLAWLISLVNGENGQTAQTYAGQTIVINSDLDMQAHTWVPIGERNNVFKGTFEGNGYTIEGLNSSLNRTDLGMFGITEGATIQNVIAQGSFDGVANNYGTIAGTMKGGTISNVEAAGVLTGDDTYAQTIGGLVGVAQTGTTIHSCFAVNTITAQRDETVVGGLVANNGGDLLNSYANGTITGTDDTPIGGLVGENNGNVENCYVVLGDKTYPAFAATNNSTIYYCYADKQQSSYVGGGNGTVTGCGYYEPVVGRKQLGYMYGDNKVNASDNDHVVSEISYTRLNENNEEVKTGRITRWPGLLSTLNHWVEEKNSTNDVYTSWLRPISSNINGDLPVLTFATGNALGTTDGKFLNYSVTSATNNGLDDLMEFYGGKTSYIFLYDDATNVEKVPGQRTYVFINEDAVLLQKQKTSPKDNEPNYNEPNFINTTVGITFDNSCKNADDYFGNPLKYDWHLMSTPLSNAPLGITYTNEVHNWWDAEDEGQVDDVENSYMPDHINAQSDVKWDFYTYDEPNYHWVNFKRSMANHYHYDEPHEAFTYTGTEQTTGKLTPGRGYMMAISTDSYQNQTGTLNNGDVPIALTVSGELPETETPSKDWGSNLVGNPYQAYLDLDVVTDKTGQSAFYVYDADNGVYGPYMTGASINTALPSKLIHPHQAFFVVTDKEKNNAGFAFSYDMATTNSNEGSYFRGGEQPKYPLVNLFVENERGNRDLAVIEFNRPELNGVRKVNNLRNANFKVSAYLGGENYGLVFTPEGTEKVPVHFRTSEDGSFTMKWQTMHGTFTSLILVDNLTGTRTDMLRNDHYTFNGSVDDYASRFYITYNVTDVEEINAANDEFIWFDGNDWIVTGQGQLDVIDVTGRVLQSRRVSGEQTRLHLDGYAAGVYMMRLTEGNKAKIQKIVIR